MEEGNTTTIAVVAIPAPLLTPNNSVRKHAFTAINGEMTNDDMALVREFTATQSEAAFAELVQRHLNFVYSVAVRQVGDIHLAQDVAQSVFIILARKAWALGDGTIFLGWLFRTTSYVAADALKAHRRRMQREQEACMQWELNAPDTNAWQQVAPLLDEAIAELGERDRTALVLRFFGNQSAREIAETLNLTEEAAQKRTTRALEKLRQLFNKRGVTLTTAVLVSVVTTNSMQAAPTGLAAAITSTATKSVAAMAGAGVAPKVAAALGKSALFSWLAPAVMFLFAALPASLMGAFIGRVERRNFRDPTGFRHRLHRHFFQTFFWGFPFVLLLFAILTLAAAWMWGKSGSQIFTIGLLLALISISARHLTICRNPFQVGMFAYGVIVTLGIIGAAVGWLPPSLAALPLVLATLLLSFLYRKKPGRMDYSLFLRAAHGMLEFREQTPVPDPSLRMERKSLLAFARYLGSRYLVSDYHWESRGLALRLAPVRVRFLSRMASVFALPFSHTPSYIVLHGNGVSTAHCSDKDAADLAELKTATHTDPNELERTLSTAVASAWREFRIDNEASTNRALGELPDSAIFVIPPARSLSTLLWQAVAAVAAVTILVGVAAQKWLPYFSWLADVRSISVSESEIRAFLGRIDPNPDPHKIRSDSPEVALSFCLVLPPTSLFTPERYAAARGRIFEKTTFQPQFTTDQKLRALRNSWYLHKAMEAGWITWNDVGLQPEQVTEYFHRLDPKEWQFTFVRREAWSWVKEQRFEAERISDFTLNQLRWLHGVNCLDIVDRPKLIAQIASVQVTSGQPPGQPPIHDWEGVRGLFFTPNWPALQDTWLSLAGLELLGGLDKIDREACIEGILRQHRGAGYFTSPGSGGYNEYKIDGNARDTFAAYESLRILDALDRVNDWNRWEFRVRRNSLSKPAPDGGIRILTWDEVEAWTCQQRLKQILHDREANPQAPARSLLAP